MRRPLLDDIGITFDQLLAGAQRSLWRFEQQPAYAVGDELRLLRAFAGGTPLDPATEPALQQWFDQIRAQTARGVRVARVRITERPPTMYQQWLQHVDRWNTEAGEEILYLPRPAYLQQSLGRTAKLWTPFPGAGTADWWLIDNNIAAIMRFDRDGHLTETEISDDPTEIGSAILFQHHAENLARHLARRPAAETPRAA